MDDFLALCILLATLFILGVHMPPTPDLKPYVQAHQQWRQGQ